jgi:DUF4097 and DUF4098 domain-containing protein YvlB
MSRKAALIAVTAVLATAPVLVAQTSLDTTIAVRAGARLSVWNMSGSVTVRSWDRSQIRVQAEYEGARIEVHASPTRVSVRTVSRRGEGDVDYTITVPQGTAAELNGVSSDVEVSGVCGEVSANAVSGDVTAGCVAGDAVIQSVSGDVTVTDARGGVEAGSTSGDVIVHGARGSVSAHTVSGDVTLSEVEGADVAAETVSGDISYAGPIVATGRYRFEAHSGDVTVRVAGTVNATISVGTFSGEFQSDFPIELTPGRGVSPGSEWEFRLGNGSARLRLRSFSGTVNLRRGPSGARREE